MKIINLPHDIFPGEAIGSDDIVIHEYTARSGTIKGRSTLRCNAVSLVLQGEKTMVFAEKTFRIGEDSFHILTSGNCLSSVNLSQQPVFKTILVFFSNKVLSDFYIKYNDLISGQKRHQSIKEENYISLKKDAFIYSYIASLQAMLKQPQPVSREMQRLKWEELFLYLLENYPGKFLAFQPHLKHQAEFELRKVVETNITNNLSVEELAFLCNMSVSTFKRRFQKLYGSAPARWLVQKRMEIAASLLQNPGESPSDVFYKVGYENHSSFSQSFKQVFGKTPSQYQEDVLKAIV